MAWNFTVQTSPGELVVRRRLAGVSQLFGALAFGAVAWTLFGPSATADPFRQLGDGLLILMKLSLWSAVLLLVFVGVQTSRYPVELVLDRARNRILVRFQSGNSKLDFTGALSDVAAFDLVDVETAAYAALVRADRLSQQQGLGAPWLDRFPALKEWAFRGTSTSQRIDAEQDTLFRLAGLFHKGSDGVKPVRLRVTMRDGEEISLPELSASPDRLETLVQSLHDFATR